MTIPILFLCARCLRARKLLPKPPMITSSLRSYSTTRQLSPRKSSIVHSSRLVSMRQFSSTTHLSLPPELSTQPSSTFVATPPPAQQQSTRKTLTLLNPRKDPETGQEMSIQITPRASNRLLQIMSKDSNPALCLRVSVESGGCHGFQYLMSLVDVSKVNEEEDTLFIVEAGDGVEVGSSWRHAARGKAKVVMDEPSLELLKGSKVDYTMELIGSQFKIADNPRASSSCGCGTSFDVKI